MRANPRNPENNPGPLEGRLSLSVDELIAATGIGKTSIYSAVQRGELKLRKVGARTTCLVSEAQAWLAGRPEAVSKWSR
jgi:hypothetical protein